MPILAKGKNNLKDINELKKKREERDSKRTKYHLIRKDRSPEEYKGIKLVVDGKEMDVSDSSKFLLEMLIQNEEIKGE